MLGEFIMLEIEEIGEYLKISFLLENGQSIPGEEIFRAVENIKVSPEISADIKAYFCSGANNVSWAETIASRSRDFFSRRA